MSKNLPSQEASNTYVDIVLLLSPEPFKGSHLIQKRSQSPYKGKDLYTLPPLPTF